MSKQTKLKEPNYIHPEIPGAVGSRNSQLRNNRDEYQEAGLVIDEEVDKILNHIEAKLPPEVMDKMDIMGGVKDKVHNYYNQNLQNMMNRYLVTVEDELLKKYRNMVNDEEHLQLHKYSPQHISDLLEKIGDADHFNSSSIETSLFHLFEHLHTHYQKGFEKIEDDATTMFNQRSDVGSFIRKENS